jgi:hypothetical protein
VAESFRDVVRVNLSCAGDLASQGLYEATRQHRDAIFRSLAVAHEDLRAAEVDILYAKAKRFHDAQASAVEQFAEQPMRSLHRAEKLLHRFDR